MWKRIIPFVLSLLLLIPSPGVRAMPIDFEIGQQLYPAPAYYGLARINYQLGDIKIIDSQLWFLPEVGVFFSSPPKGYVRGQILLDTPLFTVGADVRYPETYGRVFVRFSL